MEIQRILFPQTGRCTENELYFRLDRKTKKSCGKNRTRYLYATHRIEFEKRGKAWFDTYFNGLSIGKWTKYTVVENVALKLKVSGRFVVTLIHKDRTGRNISEKVILEQILVSDMPQEFVVPYTDGSNNGMYTFALEALEDGSIYYGGAYVSDVAPGDIRDIKIGIGICTFRREAYVERNLKLLNETILQNQDSPLWGHVEVFISDNGKSLEADRLASGLVHIFPNKNLGGAGGFTRNMIEMSQNNDRYHITHILLMDDDIIIEPEALVKTYTLLSLARDEYTDAFIGGAMLRTDLQYRQVESGAVWNGGNLDSLKSGLDLRSCAKCLDNEVEERAEFHAWWYCCFPIGIVREDNLPLPIFIRGDDLEYGLRNMKRLILMNGICVWHEPFENKYSSFLEYYIMRNQLIDNSFHCQWYGKKQLGRAMIKHCMQEIMFYRYRNVDLYLQGIRDFLKGPGWLMEQDGEALHRKVMAEGYRGQDLEELPMGFNARIYRESLKVDFTAGTRILRNLSFNGIILPAKGENIVSMTAVKTPQCYRRRRIMYYDESARKAFVVERSLGQTVRCLAKMIGMLFVIHVRLKGAQKAYREEGMRLRSLEFWKGYLEI